MEKNAPKKLVERVPAKPVETPRDAEGKRTNTLKGLHRAFGREGESLKAFARRCLVEPQLEAQTIAGAFFHNKRANFSKPQKQIGRTRKKTGSSGGKPTGK